MALKLYEVQENCIACGAGMRPYERRLHQGWRDFLCCVRTPHFHVRCQGCGWKWLETVVIKATPLPSSPPETYQMREGKAGVWLEKIP